MIILISGEDTYRATARFKTLVKAFKEKHDPSGFNVSRFDGPTPSFDEVQSAFGTVSFLASKRMVAFEDFFAPKTSEKQKQILTYILEHDSDDQVTLFLQRGPLPGASSRLTFIKKATNEEYDLLEGAELSKWISAEAKKRNISFDLGAQRLFEERVGADLWTASNVLDQLQAFSLPNKGKVSSDAVIAFTQSVGDDNIFHLTDELAHKNRARALELFHEQLESGAHPLYILTMLVRQFRIFLQLSQKDAQQMTAGELGMHPYVLQKSRESVRAFTPQSLRVAYAMLERMDKKLKTGEKDAETLFSRFIFEVTKG